MRGLCVVPDGPLINRSTIPQPSSAHVIEMTDRRDTSPPIPWCSIVTVTYNSAPTIEHFWSDHALADGVEWIVVDNASTDDTVSVAQRLGAKVIRLDRNRGFSYANNVGYDAATADFIGFVNPDVRLNINAIHVLEDVAARHDAIVGPQLYNADGSRQPNGRGYPTLAAKVRNRLRGDDPSYLLFSPDDDPRAVVWLMGAAVFGHREKFDRFGAWDSHFFLYYEDSDLGLRSWKAGVPVLLVPQARMEHGWARETAGRFRLSPWMREIASMSKFYSRYPSLLLHRQKTHPAFSGITRAVFSPLEREG